MKRMMGFILRLTTLVLAGLLIVLPAASATGDVITGIGASPRPILSGSPDSAMVHKSEPSSTDQSLAGVAVLNDWGTALCRSV
jgi:hypothetical protein